MNVLYNPERSPPAPLLSAGRESVSVWDLLHNAPPRLLVLSVTLNCSHADVSCFLRRHGCFSLFHQSIVLCDALSSELFQDVVEVSGVGEAVARQVGTKLGLMVDLEEKAKMMSFVSETTNLTCMDRSISIPLRYRPK